MSFFYIRTTQFDIEIGIFEILENVYFCYPLCQVSHTIYIECVEILDFQKRKYFWRIVWYLENFFILFAQIITGLPR